jgi:outer membrane receptor protein involved in Fe transport
MKKLLLILSIIIGIQAFSQRGGGKRGNFNPNIKGEVTGKVLTLNGDQPVEFASIAVHKLKDSSIVSGAITNQNGEFIIKDLSMGRYYITANFIGFHKKKSEPFMIVPKKLKPDLGIIKLEEASQQIGEVEVVRQASSVHFKADRKVLNIGADITNAGGTAVEALENMPSVETDIDGEVSIRGSSNFQVLINGKPSPLSGTDALEQIPVEMIRNIELITNPSAKYDPEGDVGIINIVTHKDKINDISLNASLSTDFRNKPSGGVTLSKLLGDNTRISLNLSAKNRVREGDMTIKRTSFQPIETTLDSKGEKERIRYSQNIGLNLSHDFNNDHTVEFGYKYGLSESERNNKETRISSNIDTTTSYFNQALNNTTGNFHSINGDYYWYLNKSGTDKLEASFNINLSDNDVDDTNIDFDNNAQTKSSESRGIDNYNSKKANFYLDYTDELEKGKLELGYHFTYYNKSVDYIYEDLNLSNNNWVKNSEVSNNYEFNRGIHSLYGNLSYNFFEKTMMEFSLQGGLRAEYTDREINLIEPDKINAVVDRFDLFPSVFITKNLDNLNSIQASYSRRINRPRDHYLNPFKNISNPLQTREGNPNLLPEYVNSFQLGYVRTQDLFTASIEGYYKETTDKIERIQNDMGNNVINMTFINSSRAYDYGIESYLKMNLSKFFYLTLNGSYSNYTIEGSQVEGGKQSKPRYNLGSSFMFMLPTQTRIQFRTMYRSKSIGTQSSRDAMIFSMLGIQQSLFNRSLSLSLNIRDLFHNMKYEVESYGDNFIQEMKMEPYWPMIQLTAKYTFNKIKDKKSKKNRNAGDSGSGDDMMF